MPSPRRSLLALLSAIATASCTTAPTPRPTVTSTEDGDLHPDVQPLAWMLGRWLMADQPAEEHWTAAGDALFGVSFTTKDGHTVEWEAEIIHRDQDGLVFDAMPGGQPSVAFRLDGPVEKVRDGATFANPAHDFPKTIRYTRANDGTLAARIEGDGRAIAFAFRRAPRASAPELLAADRRFAEDAARRGADGWADNFDPEGGMGGRKRVARGRAEIRAAIKPVFDGGGALRWEPIASGLSPAGDLGYTVGRFRAEAPGPGGTTDVARGAYVTIWRRGADGTWRVLFDVGDPEGMPR